MRRVGWTALAVLVGCLVPSSVARADAELVKAFLFGSRQLDCPTYNDAAVSYTTVFHGSVGDLAYDAQRGWGYEVTQPGESGYAVFGPFDDSPNSRNQFADTCPEEIYDSFIGAKGFSNTCAPPEIPCLPLEGIVFRVDLPNGVYRFVAAVGSADNVHAHRVVVEDGGSGPPADLGEHHVVLVDNFDQAEQGAGVFARVGFDGLIPPPASGPGFVDMDENGRETAGAPSSPELEVTQGYLRLHQLKGATTGTDGNGGDMVILEIWRIANSFEAVSRGSTWKFLPGLDEASAPDAAAWRQADFNDDAWASGAAPFGYGEAGIATDLSGGTPPMQGNYTSLFLRQTFELANPAFVNELVARVDYDDGFLLWINGTEVLRINVPGLDGTFVPHDDLAPSGHEHGLFEDYSLPDPSGYLVSGTNVACAQIFNTSRTSTDLFFDLGVFDPVAPDVSPPSVSALVPVPGRLVRSLEQIQVTFTEEVTGVDAGDLLINGLAAGSMTGTGPGPYTFRFAEPAEGLVDVSWASDHGITDMADFPNPFGGGSWSYTLDPSAPLGSVRINEVLAVNGTDLQDEDGSKSDWIELYNDGETAVDLEGWSLTQDRDGPREWVFPAVSIAPGDYLVLFASGKDRRSPGGELHTNFQLGSDGEYLGLFNPESPPEVVSEIAPRLPVQRSDISYGVDAAGEFTYFAEPTPGAPNAGGSVYEGFVLPPLCSPGRGFYEDEVLVTITTGTPGASIRYTLDGSEPTPTFGTRYSSPVRVAPGGGKGAVVLRAVAYGGNLLASEVMSHTYIFCEEVMNQVNRPAGFPAAWSAQSADYEMDPEVVGDPGHTDLIRNGLKAIPTLSISTHVDNLFDASQGIYANPSREGEAWERPVSAELLYPDGRPGFHVDCGLRIQGGSSTSNWKALKVSMRLLFKGDYGPTKLRFPLFPDTRVDRFNSIVLDAHLNQTWNHPSDSQRRRAQYCRDQFVSDLQNAAGGYAPHDIFAHVYLDGLYWGVYDLHERPDAAFAAEYFGGDDYEYDCLRHTASIVVDGDKSTWNAMMAAVNKDLSSNNNYVAVFDHLDVPNFIDYMMVNFYAGNDDWDHHNWYATSRGPVGGGFRFHSWDAEHVLKDVNINRVNIDRGPPTGILWSLRDNAEFRLLFADHVHRQFAPGGIYYVDPDSSAWDPDHPERNVPAAIWMRRIEEVDGYLSRDVGGDDTVGSAISCESARWGDAKSPSNPYTRNNEWLTELNWLLHTYFPARSAVVLNQLRSAGLYPDVDAPVFSRQGGQIDPGLELALSRPAGTTGTIYYTTDGTDPRLFGSGAVSARAAAYDAPIVLNDFTTVKARILAGGTWSALSEATFTLLDPISAVRVSEIMYNPRGADEDLEFIELTNVASATVGLSGSFFADGIVFQFPPGTALAPGGYLVLVSDPAAFQAVYPSVEIDGVYEGRLSNGGERITLAGPEGETIFSVEYDDDGLWPVGPDGFGYSLVPVDPLRPARGPDSWRVSGLPGGSPGADDPLPLDGGVVISEVLARAGPPLEGAIEVVNLTATDYDIGGWYLSNNRQDAAALRRYSIPDGTVLPPGGRTVFYEYEFNANPEGPSSFALDPAGGAVYLSAAGADGELTGYIVEARYGAEESGVSFGRIATSTGYAFGALRDRSFGADLPGSVEEFRTGVGLPNGEPRFGPGVINEIQYHPVAGREEFIELYNPTMSPVPLFDVETGLGWRLQGVRDVSLAESFEFGPGDEIPAQGYALLVGIDPPTFRRLHSVSGAVPIFGPYGGQLDNGGEHLRLLRPAAFGGGDVRFITVDDVRYDDEPPWMTAADGLGPSLERVFAASYGNDPVNWEASSIEGGTPGGPNTAGGSGGNRPPKASFSVSPESGDAPLDVLFDASLAYDLDGTIVAYAWDFGDGSSASGQVVSHRFTSPQAYTVSLTVEDDDGEQDSVARLVVVEEDQGGNQLPGDSNQDGALDISDALSLLRHLFLGGSVLPCGGSTLQDGGNKLLLDVNGDDGVDITDAVYVLGFLFQGGPPPVLGTECTPIIGCPDACH